MNISTCLLKLLAIMKGNQECLAYAYKRVWGGGWGAGWCSTNTLRGSIKIITLTLAKSKSKVVWVLQKTQINTSTSD